MKRRLAVIALCALVMVAPLHAQTRDTQQKNLEKYLAYAGEPVDKFQFWALTQWELVGPDKVVVWPRMNQAFLLTVDEPCQQLQWAKSIALTSSVNTVTKRFDSVIAGRDRCRINEIQPIDYARYLKDRSAERKDKDAKP